MNDPGLVAVRTKFGEAMEQRFLNWPQLAENEARAHYETPPHPNDPADVDVHAWEREHIAKMRRKAEDRLDRARNSPDFALDQAERIARWVPREGWKSVPSVRSIREYIMQRGEGS